jgi:hypothetical protein
MGVVRKLLLSVSESRRIWSAMKRRHAGDFELACIRLVLHHSRRRKIEQTADGITYNTVASSDNRQSVRAKVVHVPDSTPCRRILLIPIPHAQNILLRTHTQHQPTNLIRIVKLVPNHAQHQILPKPIRDALLQPYNPLPASDIPRVFPHWPPDLRVEEKVVCGGLHGRGRVEVRPEGPEGFNLYKRGRRGTARARCELRG